ncbi:peptidase family M48-domain-containing protein [Cyathus striatus]|nr:peptidase family M48-domain-containing protein [Cyathus striatus]
MDFLHSQLAKIQTQLAFVQTDPIDWKLYVQAFSWTVTLFESYLLIRQYPLYSKSAPPSALAEHFTPAVFEKSQKYGRDKARFAFFSGLFKQCLTLPCSTLASTHGLGTLPDPCWDASDHPIHCFRVHPLLAVFHPTLPLSVYNTFVLEERHGFNKTTPALFVADLFKGWALAFALGAPFLAAFLYIFQWAGDRFVPWISFQLIMVVLYPTVIQPLFNKLSTLPEGELRTRIEALAGKLHFPLKHLYEIDGSKRSSHSNAYFFGLPWSKHIVIFDTLIHQSSAPEVEAVLAHELGHWFYLHPTKMLLISQLHIFTILSLFPAFLYAPPLLRAFDFPKATAASPPTIVAFLLFQMILTPLEAVVSIAMNAVSRHFEWEADRFAVELQDRVGEVGMKDMGDRLGRALVTLHVKNLSTVWVDWLYSAYHHSHPTLTERLKGLEAFQAKREKKKL